MPVRTHRLKVREAKGKQTPKKKISAAKQRPILRQVLWDKLVERMVTLTEKELTWQ